MQIPHLFFGSFLIKIGKSQKNTRLTFNIAQAIAEKLFERNISRRFSQKKVADYAAKFFAFCLRAPAGEWRKNSSKS
jgi:hypothetical protein